MKGHQNVVGTQVQAIRQRQQMKQEDLSAKCGVLGWDISRGTLAKVEAQLRCVTDRELWILAKALKVKLDDLYPAGYRG